MGGIVLQSTVDLDRQEWLSMRQKGIGGSDAAAIAGLNRWKSPLQVYLEKLGDMPEKEVGEAAYWGIILEDVVAKEFTVRTGKKVRRRNAILQHPDHPFMIANVDRLIEGEKVGLECKTTSAYLQEEWQGDEVPAAYLLQCQHYMAVTGYEAWWIAVLIGGNKFACKKIVRDEELINILITLERNFWENVQAGIPPTIDGSDASTEVLKIMYPESTRSTLVELPKEAIDLADALKHISAELRENEALKKEYENRLKGMLGEIETGQAGDYTVSWRSVHNERFDAKAFKQEHPELHKKYLKSSAYRRFHIKEVNHGH